METFFFFFIKDYLKFFFFFFLKNELEPIKTENCFFAKKNLINL